LEETASEAKFETIIIQKQKPQEDEEDKEYKDRMVIRSFSSMILFTPTLIVTLILGLTQMILNDRRGGIANIANTVNTGYMNIIGVIFFTILTLNFVLVAFDFDRMLTIIMVILAIAIIAIVLLVNVYTGFIQKIIANFPDVKIYLSTQFYILFAILLFIIIMFTWVRTLFNYYVIEGNELIHHKGLGAGVERYPATNMSVKKEYPDLIEHLIFRSGTLVLAPPKAERAIVLRNVIGIDKKVRSMNEILSRMKVDID